MSLADQILNRLSGLDGWNVSQDCELVLRELLDGHERELTEWRERYEQLFEQLAASNRNDSDLPSESEYVEYRGLVWRRIDPESVEPAPHCRKCKQKMVAFPSAGLWCCDSCKLTMPYVRHPQAAE